MDASGLTFAGTNWVERVAASQRPSLPHADSVQLSIDDPLVGQCARPGPASRLHLSMSVCIYEGLGRLDFG